MTFARKEEILSKDILTIADVMELNDMTYQPAAELVRNIKRVMNSQYRVVGKITTNDYVNFFEKPRSFVEKSEKSTVVKARKPKVQTPLFRAKEYLTNMGE